MPYPYLGTAPRLYPQYRDDATDAPLQAEPGGTYSMTPVAGNDGLPVPPGDGSWGPEQAPAEKDASEPAPPADGAEPVSTTVQIIRNGKAAAAAEEGAGE
jgi:hypothetical protein